MVVSFPYCTFKCGKANCHNYAFRNTPNIEIEELNIAYRYKFNPITKAIVFSGFEPFDSFNDMIKLIEALRRITSDPIVIFTGYDEDEVKGRLAMVTQHKNIIVKFGRYIPNKPSRKDEILGVTLASDNQYAKEYK